MYLFVTDSPGKLHDPQNPIKENMPELSIFTNMLRNIYRNRVATIRDLINLLRAYVKLVTSIFKRNVLPSLRSVLSNITFWIVAIAHSGGLMVCSSIRILGTYFRDTSYGAISENQAGLVTLFLSVGVLVGLFFGGNAFSDLSDNPRARKAMVSKLYFLTVTMCYCLAFLAIPFVRTMLGSPVFVALLQAIATFLMGAGVAVQVYCIPAIVGCTFGANKGLYAAYTEGVAYTVSSIVWRIMGNAVEEGNPQGSGWAYGWAAVALLVVLAGFLMVEFIEHYFCRGGWIGRLRDAKIRAEYDQNVSRNFSFRDDSSVTKLAESGKKIWENRPNLFRRTSQGKKREPDMHSILLIDEDEDDVSTIIFENVGSEISTNFFENVSESDIQQRLADMMIREGNESCIDCGSADPRWTSIIASTHISSGSKGTLGVFCCTDCAGSHRKLGTHLAYVRSIDHDLFKSDDIRALERGGNLEVNQMFEANLSNIDGSRIKPSSTLNEREKFIFAKYKEERWYQRAPLSLFRPPEIELVHGPSSPNIHIKQKMSNQIGQHSTDSIFEQVAPFDQNTVANYESFVRYGSEDSQSHHSKQTNQMNENDSICSEESDAWQISHARQEKGLDVYIDL